MKTLLNSKKAPLLAVCLTCLLVVGCENAQRGTYNIKADVTGTERTAYVYTELNGKLLKTITDSSMVVDEQRVDTVTLWLGSKNKKVLIKGGIVIVEDN